MQKQLKVERCIPTDEKHRKTKTLRDNLAVHAKQSEKSIEKISPGTVIICWIKSPGNSGWPGNAELSAKVTPAPDFTIPGACGQTTKQVLVLD